MILNAFDSVYWNMSVVQVKILTFAGVEVRARPLKRGDSYDFHVAVPAKPAQLRSLTLGSRSCSDGMTLVCKMFSTLHVL